MTTHTGQFTLERRFATNIDALWDILTDPISRQAWAAPSADHVLHIDKADLREDGIERHRCGPKDDPEYCVDTRWYKLAGPDVAVFTEALEFGGARVSVSLVSYDLKAAGAETDLSIMVTVTSFEGPEMIGEHESGWTSAIDRLQQNVLAKVS